MAEGTVLGAQPAFRMEDRSKWRTIRIPPGDIDRCFASGEAASIARSISDLARFWGPNLLDPADRY